jgi:ankyrin repeat protein
MGFFKTFAVSAILLATPLIAQAPKPAAPAADGTTPLHVAVRANDIVKVQSLLRAGADASSSNRYGITPLSLAAENGNAEIVAILMKAGADTKAMLPGAQTLLMTAARTGNPEVVKLLLDRGANPNAKESTNGETALMWAAAQNHPEAVRVLAGHGADLNARSLPLQYKTDRFGLEGVLTILPRGNWTPLMYAAREGSLDAAKALAEVGADLNLTDPESYTAMVISIINGHYDTAAILVEKGANPELGDSSGMGALYAAVDMNTPAEIYGNPPLKSTSRIRAIDLMKILLDHGANVNAQLTATTVQRVHTPGDRNLGTGATPLMRATRNGDAAAMRLLLSRGADPTLEQKNKVTALMLAAGLGRDLNTFADEHTTETQMLETVKILLEQHVNVNAANDAGQTALHFAALSMDSVVELLVKNGANIDAADKQGRTPLAMAQGKGGPGRAGQAAQPRPSTIELLRKLGAK